MATVVDRAATRGISVHGSLRADYVNKNIIELWLACSIVKAPVLGGVSHRLRRGGVYGMLLLVDNGRYS